MDFTTQGMMMSALVSKYSLTQRALHWLTLLLLFVSFFSHESMVAVWDALTEGGGDAVTPALGSQIHVYTGIAILVLTVLRLIVRVTQGAPAPVVGMHPLLAKASSAVHGLLYLVLLAIPLSGMAAWFAGFTELGDVHGVLFNIALGLVAIHIAAALYHQFVLRDNLIARMR
ncbi:cytochrome b [Pararhodobacter zhoushanensis]|uniref:cytochrome b n=1 Tax=Pararhodobacter zhoushanensis TaxID=2479545 RepID=UPI0013E0A93C|nr:cytochrome b/b6 domain-containing protein [Pararhodobacter zhoushanensis]